jgi:hypothetical protein
MTGRVPLLAWVLLLAGCAGSRSDAWEYDWSPPRPDPALVDGAWVRMRTVRYLCPAFTEQFAGGAGGPTFARTEADLRPLLRPVHDGPSALAYLDLIQGIELDGGPDVEAVQGSWPLRLDARMPETEWPFEAYRPSDAARWGIPNEPEIVVVGAGVEVRRAVFRPLREGEREGPGEMPDGMASSPGVVEWVADTVTSDGRVSRRVLRVLESGPSARRFGPTPLL